MVANSVDGPKSSNTLLVITTLLLIWTTLFVGVRSWAKWQQKQWSWFDAVFMAGYVLCLAQCTATYLATAQYGFGQGPEAFDTFNYLHWKKSFYASELLYVLCVGASRCSTAFFLRSLSRERKHKLAGLGLASFAGVWTLAATFTIALRGNLSEPWMNPGPSYKRWLGVEVAGLIVELSLWVFAAALVWGLNMKVMRRVKLILIFATRLALIPVVALRLIRLNPSTYHDSIYDISMVNYFTQAVMHFSLIAECFTCLKPFLQTFHEGFAISEGEDYWGGLSANLSGQRSNPQLSNNSNAEKFMKRPTLSSRGISHESVKRPKISQREISHDSVKLRADRSGFSTRIESDRRGHHKSRGEDDIELLPSSNIWVQQTTTLSSSR